MDDDRWEILNARSFLKTITFRIPKEFRKAVAASLGRVGDTASMGETEEFIREAVKLNIMALMEEHGQRRSSLRARVRRSR